MTLLLALACEDTPGPDQGVIGREPDAPSHAWMDELPHEVTGELDGGAHPSIVGAFDPTLQDAVTAYADCVYLFDVCLSDGTGNFDGCVDSVAICRTDEPWTLEGPCCPSACEDAYDQRRAAGEAGFDAWLRTYALAPEDCFAGLPEGGL